MFINFLYSKVVEHVQMPLYSDDDVHLRSISYDLCAFFAKNTYILRFCGLHKYFFAKSPP